MSLCRRCAKNGTRKDGGDFGVCQIHRRTKCIVCKSPSLGEEMCASHAHQAELHRWQAKANLRLVDPADDYQLEIRMAGLRQAKFHAHEAVEVAFRALVITAAALWGSAEVEKEKAA